MAKLVATCPYCQGNLLDDHGVIKCLQCSREITGKGPSAKYHNANKEAILACVDQVGRPETIKRFRLPSSSLHSLLKRWGRQNGKKPAAAPAPAVTIMLPELPAFSNDWDSKVQIEWLRVFESLTRGEK